jgi:hypothetical protein
MKVVLILALASAEWLVSYYGQISLPEEQSSSTQRQLWMWSGREKYISLLEIKPCLSIL